MLRTAPKLDFPEHAKPYIESYRGRLVPKVSPFRRHGRLQSGMSIVLDLWAGDHGEVATEWRFFLTDAEGRFSSFLPDVAYVSFARLPKSTDDAIRERPTIAPDLAVEIFSPSDRKRDLAEKIETYLAAGSILVLVVTYESRTVAAHDAGGVKLWHDGETFTDDRFPDLAIDLAALFARAD